MDPRDDSTQVQWVWGRGDLQNFPNNCVTEKPYISMGEGLPKAAEMESSPAPYSVNLPLLGPPETMCRQDAVKGDTWLGSQIRIRCPQSPFTKWGNMSDLMRGF